jgi:hypothetical protein
MASFLYRALGDTEAAPSSPTPAENEVPWEASVG